MDSYTGVELIETNAQVKQIKFSSLLKHYVASKSGLVNPYENLDLRSVFIVLENSLGNVLK